mgnify:CR=1 FL=1
MRKQKAALVVNSRQFAPVLRMLQRADTIAIDTETTGLKPFGHDRLVGLSVCADPAASYYLPVRHGIETLFEREENMPAGLWVAVRQALLDADRRGVTWVMWNAPFDHHFLRKEGIPLTKPADAQVLWHLIDERPSNKLLERSKAIGMDLAPYEAVITKHGGHKNICRMSPETVYEYACEDARASLQLYHEGCRRMDQTETHLQPLWPMERDLTSVIIGMEDAGVPVDMDRLAELRLLCQSKMDMLSRTCAAIMGHRINLGSPKALQVAFGISSTRKDELIELEHEAVSVVREYRQWSKCLSSFLDPMWNMTSGGRAHPTWNQVGTETGRWSSTGLSFQSLPRLSEVYRVRECIAAPPGMKLVFWDYAQAEIRLIAHYSRDPMLLRALINGEDIHGQTAADIYGSGFTKAQRSISKTVNFAAVYGVSPKTLYHQIRSDPSAPRVTMEEVVHILNKWYFRHRIIFQFARKAKQKAQDRGFIKMWDGRRRHYDIGDGEASHKAWSNLIQGAVAEIIKVATLRVVPLLEQIGGRLIMQVHDELVAEVPEEHAESIARAALEPLQDFSFRVPIVVDAFTGTRWSEKVAVHA